MTTLDAHAGHRHRTLSLTGTLSHRWMAAAPVAIVAFLAMWTPTDDGPTLCPFALMTGIACPGCGMSRALAWLVRGDFGTAVTYHPLAPMLAAIALGGTLWWLGRVTRRWSGPPVALINTVLIGFGVLLLAVWGVRMASGTLPPV